MGLRIADLCFVFENVFKVALGACDDWLQAKMKLALIPKLKYLPRVMLKLKLRVRA